MLMTSALEVHQRDEGGEIQADQHAAENTATMAPYTEHSKQVVRFIFSPVNNKKELINYIPSRTNNIYTTIVFVLKH